MVELFGGEMLFVQYGADEQIKVKIEDEGGGKFFVIETTRWSFDKIDELVKVLDKAMAAFKTTEE